MLVEFTRKKQDFFCHLREVWETGSFADVEVICSDGRLLASSCLLSAASPMLRQLLACRVMADEEPTMKLLLPDAALQDCRLLLRLLVGNTDEETEALSRCSHVAQLLGVDFSQRTKEPSVKIDVASNGHDHIPDELKEEEELSEEDSDDDVDNDLEGDGEDDDDAVSAEDNDDDDDDEDYVAPEPVKRRRSSGVTRRRESAVPDDENQLIEEIEDPKSGETSFRCRECGATFRRRSSAAVHVRAHIKLRQELNEPDMDETAEDRDELPVRVKQVPTSKLKHSSSSAKAATRGGRRKKFCQIEYLKAHGFTLQLKEGNQTKIITSSADLEDRKETSVIVVKRESSDAAMDGSDEQEAKEEEEEEEEDEKEEEEEESPARAVLKKDKRKKLGLKKKSSANSSGGPKEPEQIQCQECGKLFGSKVTMKNHLLTHDKERRVDVCNICGKHLTGIRGLKSHMQLHTGERVYQCDQCPMSYFQLCSLRNHQKKKHPSESDPKPKEFLCPFCGKSFKSKFHMEAHMTLHTGEKKYHCKQCGKSFRSPSVLTNHLRMHAGTKNFVCQVCGKAFVQKCALIRHNITHTGIKPHACSICPKAFVDRGDLKKHIRRMHGDMAEIPPPAGLGRRMHGDMAEIPPPAGLGSKVEPLDISRPGRPA